MNSTSTETHHLEKSTVWLMAVSVGMIVANIYYVQPLLAMMARDFQMNATQAATPVMLTQIGTAIGMLFFVPLGDLLEKRALISTLLIGEMAALVLTALSRNSLWLNSASAGVGILASTTHIIIPYAATLAPEKERGYVVGTIFSGLLIGILLARVFSGFVGAAMGWRAVYWLAALMMGSLAALIRWRLPQSRSDISLSYRRLMQSLIDLIREHPALRESALLGPTFFIVFSIFWTPLIFRLETAPLHYGARVAGLFGLVGAAGALGAPYVGKWADRRGARTTVGIAFLICLGAYLWLLVAGSTLIGLAIGAVILDTGVQAGHVSNQTRIYALDADARSRLNTVYIVCYFMGGALGSFLGTWAWRMHGWNGVCVTAIAILLIALGFFRLNSKRFIGATTIK